MTAIKSRKPTGAVPWPLVLVEGAEKTGKSWALAEFTASEKVGQAYWLDLGEGAADEYAAIPGANYLVIEHDGTWADIVGQVSAVRQEAQRAHTAGEKPGLKVPTTANGRRAAAYNAAAFGVGAAFALASGFDADGKFTGQFDTGSNSSSQLEKGFGQFTDEIAPLLEGILEAVKNKEPIRATVNVDQGTGMANIAIMKGGI